MRCDQVKKIIPVYMDGELGREETLLVKEHITSCAACCREIEAFEQSWAMLGEWKDIPLRSGYISRFWTRVSEELSWQERIIEGFREGLRRRPAPAFVAACLALLVGIFALRNYFQTQTTDQMLANLEEDEMEMVENMELAENFDIIEDMDFFEDMEIIESAENLETI
jgi:hypothetical protein